MRNFEGDQVRGCLVCRRYCFTCKGLAGVRTHAPCPECERWSVWLQCQARVAAKAYRRSVILLLIFVALLAAVVAWVQWSNY